MSGGLVSGLGLGLSLAERGMLPLPLLRAGIRRLLAARLAEVSANHAVTDHRSGPTAAGSPEQRLAAFARTLDGAPVAPVPEAANAQHYELPAAFFGLVLGPHLKYSGSCWPAEATDLAQAERAALDQLCERARLADGQRILELGCGWGSLSLHMARRFPGAEVVAVSNSAPQRAFIESRAPANLRVMTADMNGFDPAGRAGRPVASAAPPRFDRVVSVEMFEHMRNWRALLQRIGGWLAPGGQLFVHVFCHRRAAYTFETEGAGNWMGRHFFSGGIMPAFDLLPFVAQPAGLRLDERWWLDGTHYQRTAAAWRSNLEHHRPQALTVLARHYGADAPRWYQRWRLFFLSCEELFGYHDGSEWGIGHYRLSLRG